MTYDAINPPELGRPSGWTNGILAPAGGRILFVAGQDAAEPGGGVTTNDFVEQFRIALNKAVMVVRAAGGGAEDIGRLTIFVGDMDCYRASLQELGSVYRSVMGRHYPAMALVEVNRLVDRRAMVEIEATAVLPPTTAEPPPTGEADPAQGTRAGAQPKEDA